MISMMDKGKAWDLNYLAGHIPWDSEKTEPELVKFVKKYFPKPVSALDVGCGTGTNVVYLANQGFDAIGMDISKVAIDIAKRKAERTNVDAKFYVGDVLDLSFLKKKFDFVFDRGCFHHQATSERKKYADSVHKVLKDNGMLLLIAMCKKDTKVTGPNKVSEDDIQETFNDKFEILEIKETEFEDQVKPLGYVCTIKKKY